MKTDFMLNWKKALIVISVLASLLIFIGVGNADDHACIHCGMMKAKFGHSWVIIEHEDGTLEGVCSVHCAAVDMALHIDQPVKKITVMKDRSCTA